MGFGLWRALTKITGFARIQLTLLAGKKTIWSLMRIDRSPASERLTGDGQTPSSVLTDSKRRQACLPAVISAEMMPFAGASTDVASGMRRQTSGEGSACPGGEGGAGNWRGRWLIAPANSRLRSPSGDKNKIPRPTTAAGTTGDDDGLGAPPRPRRRRHRDPGGPLTPSISSPTSTPTPSYPSSTMRRQPRSSGGAARPAPRCLASPVRREPVSVSSWTGRE